MILLSLNILLKTNIWKMTILAGTLIGTVGFYQERQPSGFVVSIGIPSFCITRFTVDSTTCRRSLPLESSAIRARPPCTSPETFPTIRPTNRNTRGMSFLPGRTESFVFASQQVSVMEKDTQKLAWAAEKTSIERRQRGVKSMLLLSRACDVLCKTRTHIYILVLFIPSERCFFQKYRSILHPIRLENQ